MFDVTFNMQNILSNIKKVESTHGTPPATRLASYAAQPLFISYH